MKFESITSSSIVDDNNLWEEHGSEWFMGGIEEFGCMWLKFEL